MRAPAQATFDALAVATSGGGPRQHRVLGGHPALALPRSQRGTPSVTLAVHNTRVCPNSTSTDPSGWVLQPRVSRTGRSWSGLRPSGRVMPVTLCQPSAQPGSRPDFRLTSAVPHRAQWAPTAVANGAVTPANQGVHWSESSSAANCGGSNQRSSATSVGSGSSG